MHLTSTPSQAAFTVCAGVDAVARVRVVGTVAGADLKNDNGALVNASNMADTPGSTTSSQKASSSDSFSPRVSPGARNVFCLKRGQGKGFSGLVNRLFFRENVRMLYGDAKETITALVSQFKD